MASGKTLPGTDSGGYIGGDRGHWGDPLTSWGIFSGLGDTLSPTRWERGLWGSYGVNWWNANQDVHYEPMHGMEGALWRHSKQKDPHTIPIFLGATWYMSYMGPGAESANDVPSQDEFSQQGLGMRTFCLNRHGQYVNAVFMSWTPRKVGLKELWTLKWHRMYNTSGEWTLPGGVTTSDWPPWLRRYKDY